MSRGRFYIETYGCQMNEYDSGIVHSLLVESGYTPVDGPEGADLILFNTCAVREKAHERIYGRLDALRHLRKRNPALRFGLLGCMAQNLGDDLAGEGAGLDLVVGPDNYRDLPEILDRVAGDHGTIVHTILSGTETYDDVHPAVVRGPMAFVTVMRGCNNYCSFCVVPYTRGKERSRPPESIVAEINRLRIDSGIREVTLLGQNVNSYRQGEQDFASLIRQVLDHTGIERIRFTSPHPHDFPDDLIDLMASEPRFMPHIHLPLQSGSAEVLKRMKRDYTPEQFLELVDRMRSRVPDLALTTDVIVGFSDESEEDFLETLKVMEAVQFDSAFMFKYSERKGTVAERLYEDNIPEEVKLDRLTRLIELQGKISAAANRKQEGCETRVLVEGTSRRDQREWIGRTPGNRTVIFPEKSGEALSPGDLVNVRILSSTQASLRGELL